MLTCKFSSNLLIAVSLVLGCGTSIAEAQPPTVKTKSDVDRLIGEFSNWGRWGTDDQRGTLNLLTPEKRLEAVKLVKTGESVSLSRVMKGESQPRNSDSFTHSMISIGRGETGPWGMDRYSIAFHGGNFTHMDSLCHLFYDGKMYNGISRDAVTDKGAEKLNILIAKEGIITRGLLIDVPRVRGVRYLEPGNAIFPRDLEAWEQQTGLKVHPGDVVFIRTGKWLPSRDARGDGGSVAGLHADCGKWLKARDIAMLGSEGPGDVLPSQVEGVEFPIHVFLLHAMGTPLFDNCDLNPLAEKAAQLNRWEFMLTASPLVVESGTGSPLNPIAVF